METLPPIKILFIAVSTQVKTMLMPAAKPTVICPKGCKASFWRKAPSSDSVAGLRHFSAPKGAENPLQQVKEVDGLKMPETLVNTRFIPIRAKSISPSRFEAIFASFFV